VLENLGGKKVQLSALPSRWAVNKFRREGREIAKVLVAEELLDNYKDGVVHQTDEATTAQESNATFVFGTKAGSMTAAHVELSSSPGTLVTSHGR